MRQFDVKHDVKSVINSKEKAFETINEFFHIYHAVEAKEEIREISKIFQEGRTIKTGSPEEDTLYFFEKLEELIDAAAVLRQSS